MFANTLDPTQAILKILMNIDYVPKKDIECFGQILIFTLKQICLSDMNIMSQ